MAEANTPTNPDQDAALEGISVAPPAAGEPAEAGAGDANEAAPAVREGLDADSHEQLGRDPSDPDAKLDIGLDETFPGSDAPANTRPGSGEPAPSSGFDPEAEAARQGK